MKQKQVFDERKFTFFHVGGADEDSECGGGESQLQVQLRGEMRKSSSSSAGAAKSSVKSFERAVTKTFVEINKRSSECGSQLLEKYQKIMGLCASEQKARKAAREFQKEVVVVRRKVGKGGSAAAMSGEFKRHAKKERQLESLAACVKELDWSVSRTQQSLLSALERAGR